MTMLEVTACRNEWMSVIGSCRRGEGEGEGEREGEREREDEGEGEDEGEDEGEGDDDGEGEDEDYGSGSLTWDVQEDDLRFLRRDHRHYPCAVLVAAHHRVPKHSRHGACLPAHKIRGFRVENGNS
jgi:hypothetical protein